MPTDPSDGALEPAAAAVAHHQQRGPLRLLDEHACGRAREREDVDRHVGQPRASSTAVFSRSRATVRLSSTTSSIVGSTDTP